ncbi:MAG: L-rhamnose/proton symporter RhaT, partial [Ignavibacteriaceae bacterium]
MGANPILGVVFHWLGGLAAGSFYAPFKGVKKWAWEVYWLIGGIFSWIIVPWVVALIMIPHLLTLFGEQSIDTLAWTFFWGVLWGFGGLTFGLSVRYLGMSLGYAIVMGYCALFGTYIPPILNGTIVNKLQTVPGQIILIGMIICLIGIMIAGTAGLSKEKEMGTEQKQKSIKEFNLKKGILVATFSGIMSSCFA